MQDQQVPLQEQLIAPQASQPQQQQQPKSLVDHLAPLIQTPMDDFLVTLMNVADQKGVLDAAFQNSTVEDQADLLDQQADPLQFLSKEELQLLITKFMAIPEPDRSKLAEQLRQQLAPAVSQRLDSIVRFTQGRDAQQHVAQKR